MTFLSAEASDPTGDQKPFVSIRHQTAPTTEPDSMATGAPLVWQRLKHRADTSSHSTAPAVRHQSQQQPEQHNRASPGTFRPYLIKPIVDPSMQHYSWPQHIRPGLSPDASLGKLWAGCVHLWHVSMISMNMYGWQRLVSAAAGAQMALHLVWVCTVSTYGGQSYAKDTKALSGWS